MMKKTVIMVMLLCAGLLMGTGVAMADQVAFAMDGLYDWGRVYNFDGSTWTPTNANPIDGSTGISLQNGVADYTNNQNDSYGIIRLTSIIDTDNASYLYDITNPAQYPYEVVVLFSGFSDVYLNGTLSDVTIMSQNGHIDLYMVPLNSYNPANPPNASTFPAGLNSGTHLLSLAPRTQVDGDSNVDYTLRNSFNFNTNSGQGYGMLLDVTGGTWSSLYDTNLMNLGTDVVFDFSSLPAAYVPGTSIPTTYRNWVVRGTANAQGNVVPEPASMTLLGLGLAGLARFRRRR